MTINRNLKRDYCTCYPERQLLTESITGGMLLSMQMLGLNTSNETVKIDSHIDFNFIDHVMLIQTNECLTKSITHAIFDFYYYVNYNVSSFNMLS